MTALTWDNVGQRIYETGVDHGVLYLPDSQGAYDDGVAWNGLTTVTESPSGAEPNAQYADNIKYLNLISAEQFAATLEAFTYPDEFSQFDGLVVPTPGVAIGQQSRKTFGLSYRTKIGSDLDGDDHGYKLHLVYGCTASPSEKAYATQNDSPEAIAFSWSIATTPVAVTGFKPTSLITIDSTQVDSGDLAALLVILYGSVGVDPALPLPDAIVTMFTGGVTFATPAIPTFNSGTHTITIPTTTGISYYIDDLVVPSGAIVITEDTIVQARPNAGYAITPGRDDDWFFDFV
jgi:hypothetical protein